MTKETPGQSHSTSCLSVVEGGVKGQEVEEDNERNSAGHFVSFLIFKRRVLVHLHMLLFSSEEVQPVESLRGQIGRYELTQTQRSRRENNQQQQQQCLLQPERTDTQLQFLQIFHLFMFLKFKLISLRRETRLTGTVQHLVN